MGWPYLRGESSMHAKMARKPLLHADPTLHGRRRLQTSKIKTGDTIRLRLGVFYVSLLFCSTIFLLLESFNYEKTENRKIFSWPTATVPNHFNSMTNKMDFFVHIRFSILFSSHAPYKKREEYRRERKGTKKRIKSKRMKNEEI
jgi:hypothetical protein